MGQCRGRKSIVPSAFSGIYLIASVISRSESVVKVASILPAGDVSDSNSTCAGEIPASDKTAIKHH